MSAQHFEVVFRAIALFVAIAAVPSIGYSADSNDDRLCQAYHEAISEVQQRHFFFGVAIRDAQKFRDSHLRDGRDKLWTQLRKEFPILSRYDDDVAKANVQNQAGECGFEQTVYQILSSEAKNRSIQLPKGFDLAALFLRALDAQAKALDLSSRFTQNRTFNDSTYGLILRATTADNHIQTLVLSGIDESFPAKANHPLRPGDSIIAVGGEPIRDFDTVKLLSVFRHAPAITTPLNVTISRPGERAPIDTVISPMPASRATGVSSLPLDPRTGIGYLAISNYMGYEADRAVCEAVIKLDRSFQVNLPENLDRKTVKSMKLLVLDLRQATGGNLGTILRIVNLFNPAEKALFKAHLFKQQTTLVAYHERRERANTAKSPCFNQILDVPLVILVDRDTASGAEILASLLQRYAGAALVGEKTFGDGTVQTELRTSEIFFRGKPDPFKGYFTVTDTIVFYNDSTTHHQRGLVPDLFFDSAEPSLLDLKYPDWRNKTIDLHDIPPKIVFEKPNDVYSYKAETSRVQMVLRSVTASEFKDLTTQIHAKDFPDFVFQEDSLLLATIVLVRNKFIESDAR